MSQPIDTASVAIVPDFTDFARKAKAGIDAALRGLVDDVDRAFAGVERAAGDAGADIGREFQQGGESAERALREVDNQARRSFNEVSRQASQAAGGISAKLGGALGIVKTGLAGLAIGAGAGLAALTVFGLKAAAQLEQVKVSFDSLLGSAEAGSKVFKDLQAFAACVDVETKAFTEDGWCSYSDLRVGQNILTLNPATGVAEWQPVEAMHVYDGTHQVLHLAGQHHESVSTLNHRWPIYARGQHHHRILFATSATLDKGDQLIAAAPVDAPVEAVYSDEFVELVAWFWTEGSIHPPSHDLDAPHARATIAQSARANPDKCARIVHALEKEFGPAGPRNWGVTGPDVDGGMTWRLSRDRAKQLCAVAPDRVPTMGFLRSLTRQQLDLFVAVSLLGDGHVRPQTGQMLLTQKRYDQAERFADAVSLSGRRCRIFQADGRRWAVSVYRSAPVIGLSHVRRSDTQWRTETLTGVVWCPQVANGTWFAQRSGHRYFTGNSTPFEFPEVAAAAQKFLAFNDAIGMSDAQLKPFLTTLGDITSVTGSGAEGLSRVTLALGQIASRGKLSLEEINQISEALPGFSGVAAIAAATGKTTAETMDAISAGSIDATTGVAALLKGMQQFPGAAGAMEKQSQTLLGVFSTFKDTLSQTLVAAFEPVIPAIKDSLTQVTPILQDALAGLAPVLGGVLSAVLPLLGQLIQGLTPILMPIVAGLGEAFKALGPSLKPLGVALGKVFAALGPLFPVIGEVAAALADALVPVIEALAPIIVELAPAVVDVVKAFLPLVPVLGQLLAALGPVLVPIAQLLALLVSLLANKAVAPLIQLLAVVIGFLAESVRQFGMWLQTINWAEVGAAIGGFFTDVWHKVTDFFDFLGRGFQALPDMALKAFVAVRTAIVDKMLEVAAFFRSIPGRILDALGNLGNLLINAGKDLVRGLWNGISSLGGWLWSQVRNFVINNTLGAVKKALGIASPSTVFADQVGREIPAGIAAGVEAGLPALQSMLNGLVPTGATQPAATSSLGGVTINLGGVHFAGVVPTEGEARRTGAAAMAGAVDALRRRDLALSVRTV